MKNFAESLPGFRKLVAGNVILPGETGYDESRAIWNGMFDKKIKRPGWCHRAGKTR